MVKTTSITKKRYDNQNMVKTSQKQITMKLYTEEQVKQIWKAGQEYWKTSGASITMEELLEKMTPIELPSDEEIIGRFMNWFLKHYSTATIDGFFGYVNALEEEVSIKEILDDYFKNK